MQWVLDPTERLKLRRQMAAAAGKKSTTLLSLFMEAYGLDETGSRSSDVETGERTCSEVRDP